MARRALLDTHVVVDIATKDGFDALPQRVRRLLEDPDTELLLSVASEIEVANKSRIGKLALTKDELALICANASITSYPLRQHHVSYLFDMPFHHRDPFDRLLISTALGDDLPVVTCDKQFRKYKGIRIIW